MSLTNEELYDLEHINEKLADIAIKINDETKRNNVLKAVYLIGNIIDEANIEAEQENELRMTA
ncbi:MAG: hypothetical protein ACOCUV_02590 [bacterium]